MLGDIPEMTRHASETQRNNNIDRIRRSLRDFPLISRNQTMIQKKLSISSDSLSEQSSNENYVTDTEDTSSLSAFEHAEIFAQKYQLREKLGEGSNGVVHRCIKRKNNKQYAVKVFMFDDQQLIEITNNFLMVKNLKHPNIITYEALYIDIKKHACWLVMQLYAVNSLALASMNSEEEIKNIGKQLLQILYYLHQRAITHRDVKLENVLYDSVTMKLKLIDFQICRKHRRRGIKFDMLTITGTLYYRAPQMFNGGGYNEKVDIWAVGVLLYKLVAGKTPFQSQYHSTTINNITTRDVIFTAVFDQYSPSLKDLISRMLKKEPSQRASASQCLRDAWIHKTHSNFDFSQLKNNIDEDQIEGNGEGLKSPVENTFLDFRSYVMKINGDEFHCIDSDQQIPKKSLKKVHRSYTCDLSGFNI